MGYLRFVLAAIVFVDHAVGFPSWMPFRGNEAVICFFIISGYLTALLLVPPKSIEEGEKGAVYNSVKSFYKSRFLRLYPAYIIILFLSAGLDIVSHVSGLIAETRFERIIDLNNLGTFLIFLVTNLSMYGLDASAISEFPQARSWIYITPAWSLTPEIAFYIIAPLIFIFASKHSKKILLVMVVATIPFNFANLPNPINSLFPFQHFFYFGLGSLIFMYRNRITLIAQVRLSGFAVAVFTLICLTLSRLEIETKFSFLLAILGLCTFVCILFTSRRSRNESFLGDMSYPIYLAHMPIMEYLGNLFNEEPGRLSLFTLILCFLVTLAVSYVIVECVDRPFRRIRQLKYRTKPQ